MPSHPDRVRRNYHTIEVKQVELPNENAWHLGIFITRGEVASWAHPDMLVRSLMQQVHDQFTRTFKRGK